MNFDVHGESADLIGTCGCGETYRFSEGHECPAPDPGSLSSSLGGDEARTTALDLEGFRRMAKRTWPETDHEIQLLAEYEDVHAADSLCVKGLFDALPVLLTDNEALRNEVNHLAGQLEELADTPCGNDDHQRLYAENVALRQRFTLSGWQDVTESLATAQTDLDAALEEVARLKSVVVEFESVRSSLDQNSPKENESETWEWYSVCSMHREAVPDCPMCKAGTWVKNSEQALSEAFFAAAPEAWVAFMNRKPTL